MRDAVLTAVCRTPVRRRTVSGGLAGAVAGVSLTVPLGLAGLALGTSAGVLFGLLFRPVREATTASLVGAATGIPLWLVVHLLVVPLATTGAPGWTPAGVQAALPALGLWLVAGGLIGLLSGAVSRTLTRHAPADLLQTTPPDEPTRIVILGGGFAGLYAARRLEELFGPDPSVELTVVSRDNATLFTPMLPEVAGGSLAPTDITTPLRTSLKRTQVLEAAATDVDVEARTIEVDTDAGPRGWSGPDETAVTAADGTTETLPYDHLILALGSVPDDRGIDPGREFVLDFKSLGDAMRVRNHVLACFERADATDDPTERQRLTRILVVGGGFAGAELAGAVNDLAHGLVRYYPSIQRSDIGVTVVHSQQRILPELNEELAAYARDRMRDRGIDFELDVRVADVTAGQATLSDGRTIRAGTVVWTAGNRPHPLLDSLDVPSDGPGAVTVDSTLSVPDRERVWAAGDCAAMSDPETGDLYPSTAQHAIRAGTTVAENVHATVRGDNPEPFSHRSQGTLAVIGHQVAVADIMGWRFSGRLAWLLWRAIYLVKIPGLAQKTRVLVSWLTDLFFPRDLVRTVDTGPPDSRTAGDPRSDSSVGADASSEASAVGHGGDGSRPRPDENVSAGGDT